MSIPRRIFFLGVLVGLLAIAVFGAFFLWPTNLSDQSQVDLKNPAQIALGRTIYADYCSGCHGVGLEGKPNWRQRQSDGRLPAPPHDDTGHTWHHRDLDLFNVTKNGPQSLLGSDYQTDMPAFGGALSDKEIWAVISFIKSTWSTRIHEIQARAEERRKQ